MAKVTRVILKVVGGRGGGFAEGSGGSVEGG